MAKSLPHIAVDIGNSRTKIGWFARLDAPGLPEPTATLEFATRDAPAESGLLEWLARQRLKLCRWSIASVQRAASASLVEYLGQARPADGVQLLTHCEFPLEIGLRQPQRVGVDRLAGAVAANRLKSPDRPAVVVDVGTATTVDLVAADGTFLGGAILPGPRLAAGSLAAACDLLPEVLLDELHKKPPPPLGISTAGALRSGLFWGAAGAMRELIAQYEAKLKQAPQVYLTGGAAELFAGVLGHDARHVPHLVLGGIAIAAQRSSR